MLAFGDSLTAGYALDRGLGFAPQLQASLRRHGIAATVVDGGVSGDTSQAGRARLGWTLDGLPRTPDLVIVELGGNDMLRALDPTLTKANLDAILAELKRRRLRVVLAGMRAAPNLDPAYIARFEAMYRRSRGQAWRDALSLLPRRSRGGGGHGPGRFDSSDLRGREDDRHAYPADDQARARTALDG